MRKKEFSLLELMITLTILLVAILGLLVAMNTLQLMNKSTKEVLLASTALNEKVEMLRSMRVPDARQAIQDTIENPTSPNAIQLLTLIGGGLNTLEGQPFFTFRYFAKEDSIPIGAVDIDTLVPQGLTLAEMQMNIDTATIPKTSFDMNLDGDFGDDATTDTDVAALYKFLPVQIRVRWRSLYGKRDPISNQNFRELIITTMLAEEKLE